MILVRDRDEAMQIENSFYQILSDPKTFDRIRKSAPGLVRIGDENMQVHQTQIFKGIGREVRQPIPQSAAPAVGRARPGNVSGILAVQ